MVEYESFLDDEGGEEEPAFGDVEPSDEMLQAQEALRDRPQRGRIVTQRRPEPEPESAPKPKRKRKAKAKPPPEPEPEPEEDEDAYGYGEPHCQTVTRTRNMCWASYPSDDKRTEKTPWARGGLLSKAEMQAMGLEVIDETTTIESGSGEETISAEAARSQAASPWEGGSIYGDGPWPDDDPPPEPPKSLIWDVDVNPCTGQTYKAFRAVGQPDKYEASIMATQVSTEFGAQAGMTFKPSGQRVGTEMAKYKRTEWTEHLYRCAIEQWEARTGISHPVYADGAAGGAAEFAPEDFIDGLGRTPWVDSAMSQGWDAIELAVGPAMMPRPEECGVDPDDPYNEYGGTQLPDDADEGYSEWDADAAALSYCVEELGCGLYGCVMPTYTEGVVCKLSTDGSEAQFVARALRLTDSFGAMPEGIVEYLMVYSAPWVDRDGRDGYLLWREEASDINFLRKGGYGEEGAALKTFLTNLLTFHATAQWIWNEYSRNDDDAWIAILEQSNDWASWAADYIQIDVSPNTLGFYSGPQRLAAHLRKCAMVAAEMQAQPLSAAVGEAFLYYMHHGLIMCDVHDGNVARRPSNGVPIIIDPGQAVPIIWDELETVIPRIET